MEVFAVHVDGKMAKIAKANAKRKGRVDPNNPKDWASNGCPIKRVNSDGLDNWAGNSAPGGGPPRCPPRVGMASLSRPSTKTSQAGMVFPSQVEMRHGQ
jgi:hypothetical protein